MSQTLEDRYRAGAFGLFVGAGLSQGAGLPSWKALLDELIAHAVALKAITPGREAELLKLSSNPSKYLLVAQELKDVLHGDLHRHIKRRFDDPRIKPTPVVKKLIKLKHRFIVTTNYDTLVEHAFVEDGQVPNDLTYKDAATINDNLLNGVPFILKAHGDARRAPTEIVLTEMDYRDVIYKQTGYQSVMQVLFSTCNVLFIGTSLDDPELKLLLGFIHNIFHGGSPMHYAFMSEDSLTQTEVERWRKDFNITIIPYDPKNNHAELEAKVDALLALVP